MQARVASGNIFLECFIFDPRGHKLREAHGIVTPLCKTFADTPCFGSHNGYLLFFDKLMRAVYMYSCLGLEQCWPLF